MALSSRWAFKLALSVVTAALLFTGSAHAVYLLWDAPVTDTNGSPLANGVITGYRVGMKVGVQDPLTAVGNVTTTSFPISTTGPQTFYLAVKALTATTESDWSEALLVNLGSTGSPTPTPGTGTPGPGTTPTPGGTPDPNGTPNGSPTPSSDPNAVDGIANGTMFLFSANGRKNDIFTVALDSGAATLALQGVSGLPLLGSNSKGSLVIGLTRKGDALYANGFDTGLKTSSAKVTTSIPGVLTAVHKGSYEYVALNDPASGKFGKKVTKRFLGNPSVYGVSADGLLAFVPQLQKTARLRAEVAKALGKDAVLTEVITPRKTGTVYKVYRFNKSGAKSVGEVTLTGVPLAAAKLPNGHVVSLLKGILVEAYKKTQTTSRSAVRRPTGFMVLSGDTLAVLQKSTKGALSLLVKNTTGWNTLSVPVGAGFKPVKQLADGSEIPQQTGKTTTVSK